MRRFGQTANRSVALALMMSCRAASAHPGMTVVSPSQDVQDELNARKKAGVFPTAKKKSMDAMMNDILEQALNARQEGEKPPQMQEIYSEAQARMYEQEYGQKPPSQQKDHYNYYPMPPTLGMARVEQLDMFDDDPAPERSITPENPVMTRAAKEELDERLQRGGALSDAEKLAQEVRSRNIHDANSKSRFIDAIEEVAFWELRYLQFLRDCPIGLRRTLPFLHEYYRLLTHRLVRACDHYVTMRDAAMLDAKSSPAVFAKTEDQLGRARQVYVETYKSLANLQADPLRMKKFFTGKILRMTKEEFEEWKDKERCWRNELIAEFS